MRLYFFLLTAVVLSSCTTKNDAPEFMSLPQGALFNRDTVSAFLAAVPESQLDSSRQVFLRGIDLLKNSRNIKSAIAVLQQSLSLYPHANGYYELGNAYLEDMTPHLALQSFQLAEIMDYKPLGNVFYKQASCYAAMDSSDKMYAYIRYAVQNGFADKRKMLNDVHFARHKNDQHLLTTYNEAMSGNGNPDEILWQGYSNDFKQASFPFVADTGTIKKIGDPQIISYDYEKFVPEMRDNKFSREVGNEYLYVARISQTELCHVVLYGCRSYESEGAPVYYILASFNPKGILIDKMIVGGAKTFDENFKVFTAKNKQQFQVEEYKNTYEKNPEEEGFGGNRVVSRQRITSKHFLIDANGRFITAQQS